MPTHRPATLGPTRVFVIRHGEKPDAPGKQTRHATPAADAIDEQGRTNPHSLIPRGWQRAGGLTALFAPADGVHREGLATPSLLLAPDRGPAGSAAHRTTQTISPLAGRLGLPVATPYPSGKEHHLISEHVLTAADACVLICWDHENIGALLQALATTTVIVDTGAAGLRLARRSV